MLFHYLLEDFLVITSINLLNAIINLFISCIILLFGYQFSPYSCSINISINFVVLFSPIIEQFDQCKFLLIILFKNIDFNSNGCYCFI